MKIVFLDASTLSDTDLSPIAACGQLVSYPTSTPEQTRQRVADCEVLITNKVVVDEALLQAAPCLKLICEAATGVNNIDLEACGRRGRLFTDAQALRSGADAISPRSRCK